MKKVLVAGNWKMYKDYASAETFIKELVQWSNQTISTNTEILICAPFVYLDALKKLTVATPIKIGAQNVSHEEQGAFTGEIAAAMLASINIDYCIIGHSERRQYYFETNSLIQKKYLRLLEHNIQPIVCIGESLAQREHNETKQVIINQMQEIFSGISQDNMQNLIIAYEPIWAIGTGKTATPEIAQEVHSFIRSWLVEHCNPTIADQTTILYGGSVKPDNLKSLLLEDDIEGGLIGGASLSCKDFISMIEIAESYTKDIEC